MKKELSLPVSASRADLPAGSGNDRVFAKAYRHAINADTVSSYYIIYLKVNIDSILTYLDAETADRIECMAVETLKAAMGRGEFSARLQAGIYVCCLRYAEKDEIYPRADALLAALNAKCSDVRRDYDIIFRAGIFCLSDPAMPPEVAVAGARWGCTYGERKGVPIGSADSGDLRNEALRAQLRKRLINAVNNHEYTLYLQFIVDKRGELVGAEGLSRWQDSELGLLRPDRYISDLNAAGLIHHLDYYILEESCRMLERWAADGFTLWLSCNITRTTAASPDFAHRVEQILSRYTFPRDRLVLELTEEPLALDHRAVCRSAAACHAMGVRLALDDLGSGFSSFRDVCDYPVDIIKLDRYLIERVHEERCAILIKHLILLAHEMNSLVLCEGVETAEERAAVCALGCDLIQGFHYFHAVPCDEADAFLKHQSKTCRERSTAEERKA